MILLTRVFVLCRLSHEKMRRCENALSTPHLSMWTNFLKTVSFLLENFCFQGAGLNAWSKDNHKHIQCKLAQHYPTASRIFSFLPVLLKQKSFKGFKELITHFLSQFSTKKKHFPTVSFISSANVIAFLSMKSQTIITSFSKKTLGHNRLKNKTIKFKT